MLEEVLYILEMDNEKLEDHLRGIEEMNKAVEEFNTMLKNENELFSAENQSLQILMRRPQIPQPLGCRLCVQPIQYKSVWASLSLHF